MLAEADYRALVSGRSRGFFPAAARIALSAAEVPYRFAVSWRNGRYDRDLSRSHSVSVPVISVGNLTVGGVGKTPLVAWLARWFRDRGVRVCVISRGYGAEAGARNDEALELEKCLPDVPHLQNPNRVEAARTAIDEFETQLILLDDAFQHRRLRRDLDLVLLDALCPFGYDHLLPRGLLREPLDALRRAQLIVLTRADAVSPAERARIAGIVRRHAPHAAWTEACHVPQALVSASGQSLSCEAFVGKPVAAFCGIGNPDGFRHTLGACRFQVQQFREFPDHYPYGRDDVISLQAWGAGQAGGIEAVVCTQKDLVKLGVDRLGELPLWALTVGIQFSAGEDLLQTELERVLSIVDR